MHVQTKFLTLREPVSPGDRIDDWRICWFGGWDKCRVFFVVMVEREFDQPVAPCNARVSRFRVSTQMLTKVDLARLQKS
jgi:hypothetical protein